MEDDRGDGGNLGRGYVRDRVGLGHPSRSTDGPYADGGGIGEKPLVVDGHVAVRNYLSLTLSFDHEIIDGAPAARFTQRLKELIESGYGLFDSTAESEPVAVEGASTQQVEAMRTVLP